MRSRTRVLARRILTFARQPLRRKGLAIEAAADLLAARLLVWRRGQYGALRTYGEPAQAQDVTMIPGTPSPVARDIAWAVNAVAPWSRRSTPCLIDALAAARMLSRRSIPWALTVGVGRDARLGDVIAHAWLSAEGRILTGRRGMRRVSAMATYSSPVMRTNHAS